MVLRQIDILFEKKNQFEYQFEYFFSNFRADFLRIRSIAHECFTKLEQLRMQDNLPHENDTLPRIFLTFLWCYGG